MAGPKEERDAKPADRRPEHRVRSEEQQRDPEQGRFPDQPTLNARSGPPRRGDPENEKPTSTGGPRNTGMADPTGPAEGGATPFPVYRPGQRTVAPDQVSYEVAPVAVHIPFGSEPRTYDPATGQDNPDYRAVSDEDVRDVNEARKKLGLSVEGLPVEGEGKPKDDK